MNTLKSPHISPEIRRKLHALGFRKSEHTPHIQTDQQAKERSDSGNALFREWAKMDQEFEDWARANSFSIRRD